MRRKSQPASNAHYLIRFTGLERRIRCPEIWRALLQPLVSTTRDNLQQSAVTDLSSSMSSTHRASDGGSWPVTFFCMSACRGRAGDDWGKETGSTFPRDSSSSGRLCIAKTDLSAFSRRPRDWRPTDVELAIGYRRSPIRTAWQRCSVRAPQNRRACCDAKLALRHATEELAGERLRSAIPFI